MAPALRGGLCTARTRGSSILALHVSILDRFKSLRDRCKLLRNSLPDIDAAFGSGQAALAAELKAVGFYYISWMLPGGLGTHAALIDDLPAVFSALKRSARDIVAALMPLSSAS